MAEPDQQKLQEMYMQFQMLDQQIKEIQKQVEHVTTQLVELANTKGSLEDLKNIKKGKEIFVPIKSGIFLKAKIEDTSELLVNVGSNVVVGKNIDQAKELIETQSKDLKKVQKQMVDQLEQMTAQAASMEKQLQVAVQ